MRVDAMEEVLQWVAVVAVIVIIAVVIAVAIDVAVGRKLDDPVGGIGDETESDPQKGATR